MVFAVFRAPIRFVLACLVLMAVGLTQLLGVSRGFWCLCTSVPKVVQTASCEPASCHESHALRAEVVSVCDVPHSSTEGDHEHHEARESLVSTAVAAAIPLPVPVAHELPPSVLVAPAFEWAIVPAGRESTLAWMGDGSPPTPVLVARTVVRLV